MSKLFEDAGKEQKRQWTCFVCGKKYSEYTEYKDHIILEHDEGREYLKCPACEAPVRDLKSHWKVKHPKRVMPKGQQDRVIVWHDFSASGQKKGTRKPKIRTGHFPSKKNGQDIYYRSGLEADFYKCLEKDKDVKRFFAEPMKLPYFFKGEWHEYTPDLIIEYIDGKKEVWEIKPSARTNDDQNKAKWASADAHCGNIGWKFVVQTEVVLDKYQAKLKRQDRLDESFDAKQ